WQRSAGRPASRAGSPARRFCRRRSGARTSAPAARSPWRPSCPPAPTPRPPAPTPPPAPSRDRLRQRGNAAGTVLRQLAQALPEIRMRHAREQEGPSVRALLRRLDLGLLWLGKRSAGRARQALEVEIDLGGQTAVQHLADAHVIVDALLDLARAEGA